MFKFTLLYHHHNHGLILKNISLWLVGLVWGGATPGRDRSP